jgi:hypothetical protein
VRTTQEEWEIDARMAEQAARDAAPAAAGGQATHQLHYWPRGQAPQVRTGERHALLDWAEHELVPQGERFAIEPLPASSWWLVTCRMDGADEDSCWCFYVASEAAAVAAAEAEERSNEDEDERALPVEERTPFYVNHVINCGQVEPTIVRTP